MYYKYNKLFDKYNEYYKTKYTRPHLIELNHLL